MSEPTDTPQPPDEPKPAEPPVPAPPTPLDITDEEWIAASQSCCGRQD
jgi:hypothetical protein